MLRILFLPFAITIPRGVNQHDLQKDNLNILLNRTVFMFFFFFCTFYSYLRYTDDFSECVINCKNQRGMTYEQCADKCSIQVSQHLQLEQQRQQGKQRNRLQDQWQDHRSQIGSKGFNSHTPQDVNDVVQSVKAANNHKEELKQENFKQSIRNGLRSYPAADMNRWKIWNMELQEQENKKT